MPAVCPLSSCVARPAALSALRLPVCRLPRNTKKTTSSRPSTNQQQIALVSIHRAPAASRGFSTPFLCQAPLQHPQLGTAPPQENVAGTPAYPPGITPCIITHWDRSTNRLISAQITTGQIRSGASAVIALFGQPPPPPSLWPVLPQFLGTLLQDKRRKYLDTSCRRSYCRTESRPTRIYWHPLTTGPDPLPSPVLRQLEADHCGLPGEPRLRTSHQSLVSKPLSTSMFQS